MKRAVKLSRREMKREIKHLKEEIKALKKPIPCARELKGINTLACAKIIPYFMIHEQINEQTNEQTIEFAKEELACDLGKYILKSGFCTVTENDGLLGHEIRVQCEVVK
jgi:hypothetical protein